MARKPSRGTLRNKADRIAGAKVRARGYCQGAWYERVQCGGPLEWCHIVSRSNYRLRWEPLNALCMCAGHHRWFTTNPLAWAEYVRTQFPENYEFVMANANDPWDKDYDRVFAELETW